MSATVSRLTMEELARIMRENPQAAAAARREIEDEQIRDKTYQLTPLGMAAAGYLRHKRKEMTKGSQRKYEAALAALALHFEDLELSDFEPPVGTTRLEEFMERRYGDLAPRTYNSCLSPIKEFFKWAHAQGELHGNPALNLSRAKPRDPHRETFNPDQVKRIIAAQDDLRDRIVLRLLLNYALRKGSIRAVQFKHFDHVRRRLTVFAKGGRVFTQPIPEPAFWHDLERLILDSEAKPSHYLMPGRRGNRHGSTLRPDTQISNHALHDWWYARLTDAGLVPEGTTSGEKMHKARHTAGQRVLDKTGNLKAVQKLLRHKSIMTTADVYTEWDDEQLAATLAEVLREEDE